MTPAPSRLEYGYGFDLALSWLGRTAYPLLAVVSMPEFVDHVASRAEGPVVFACEDARTRYHACRRLASGDLRRGVAERSQVWAALEMVTEGEAFGGVVWAAPQPGTWPARLAAIARLLVTGGPLCVLTGTRVGALTRPLRVRREVGEPAPLDGGLCVGLAAAGWGVTRARRLGGIASVGWAIAGRLAALAGRPDLADRAERAHHLAVDSEAAASYALLLAVRGAGP